MATLERIAGLALTVLRLFGAQMRLKLYGLRHNALLYRRTWYNVVELIDAVQNRKAVAAFAEGYLPFVEAKMESLLRSQKRATGALLNIQLRPPRLAYRLLP